MSKRKTTEQFIAEAKQVHGDKYDYSKVEYKDYHTKVCIICPIHGEFWQTPADHLNNHGCPKCKGDKSSVEKRKTTEQFIKDAKLIHGDKYDYSKIEYKDCETKVCIICPEHGEFWQTPHNHLRGQGCPICNESRGEKYIKQYLIDRCIKFEEQKRFDSCRNKNTLPFDFYLPDYNLCIEFQGRQHYMVVEAFGGQNNFDQRQINDKIKREWCSLPDTPNLLEIKYIDNISSILNEVLG